MVKYMTGPVSLFQVWPGQAENTLYGENEGSLHGVCLSLSLSSLAGPSCSAGSHWLSQWMLAGGLITTIQSSVLLVLSPASPPHVILPASPCKVEEMFDDARKQELVLESLPNPPQDDLEKRLQGLISRQEMLVPEFKLAVRWDKCLNLWTNSLVN